MPTIAIRKNAWDNATEPQRQILRWSSGSLALGVPATYRDGALLWYVFDDPRFTLEHVAILGALVKKLSSLPRDWTPPMIYIFDESGNMVDERPNRAASAGKIAELVKNVVLPRDITYPEEGDRWQATIDAQGNPGAIRATSAVPVDWRSVDDDV